MLLGFPEPPLGMGLFMVLVMWVVPILGFSKIHRISEYPFSFKVDGEMGVHIP